MEAYEIFSKSIPEIQAYEHVYKHAEKCPLGSCFVDNKGDYYFVSNIEFHKSDYGVDAIWLKGQRLTLSDTRCEITKNMLVISDEKHADIEWGEYMKIRESIKKRFYDIERTMYRFTTDFYQTRGTSYFQFKKPTNKEEIFEIARATAEPVHVVWFCGEVDTFSNFKTFEISNYRPNVKYYPHDAASHDIFSPCDKDERGIDIVENHFHVEHKFRDVEIFHTHVSKGQKVFARESTMVHPFDNHGVYLIDRADYEQLTNVINN